MQDQFYNPKGLIGVISEDHRLTTLRIVKKKVYKKRGGPLGGDIDDKWPLL
jgi:hypothetical protein